MPSDAEHERRDHEERTGPRALIVEDSAAMRSLVAKALARTAVTVDEAPDGVDALRKLRRREYRLLLVDLNMPRIDGLKLIQRVRALDKRRRTRIVVITGDATAPRDRERALSLGADHFLTKPIKPAELAELVAEIVAQLEP